MRSTVDSPSSNEDPESCELIYLYLDFPLPAECFHIILHVFKCRQDTATLATLLRVNKSISQAVLPVLYADPYHLKYYGDSITHGQNSIHDLIKLTRLLLRQSPQDRLTDLLKAAYFPGTTNEDSLSPSNSPPSNQPINYRSHINKLNLEHVPDSFGTIFNNKTIQGYNTLRTFLYQSTYGGKLKGFLEDQLLRDLTWALCDPGNLQELALPLTEVERYLDVLDRFSRLSSVVFVNDARFTAASSEPDTEMSKLLDGMVQFVERHAARFPNKMRQARCTPASDTGNNCPEEIHNKLAFLLPPLPAPSFLDYTNWTQFVLRSNDINLDHVIRILGDGYPDYKKVQFMDRLFAIDARFLQRCRSLETLNLDIRAQEALNMFRWAAEEQDDRELDLANGRTSKRPVPLREVSLSIANPTQYHILSDIVHAFGDTLTNLYFYGHRLQGHMGSQALLVDISEKRLDRLTKLSGGTSDGILLLHPDLLRLCPSLKTLSLNDNYAERCMREHPTFRFYEPAILEHVTTISLIGTPAVAFHPDTLHSTKNLESLQLVPWDTSILGLRDNDFNDSDEDEDEEDDVNEGAQSEWQRHQAEDEDRMTLWPRLSKPVWTWNWNLPKLTELSLSFEYAHNLRFKMFRGTPNLTRLQLYGASNYSALGPLIDPLSSLALSLLRGDDYEDYNYEDGDIEGNWRDNDNDEGDQVEDSNNNNDFTGDVSASGTTLPRGILLPKLRDFHVNGSWQLDGASLRHLFTQIAPNIVSLCLHGPFGFTVEELVETTSQHLPHLGLVDSHMSVNGHDAQSAGIKRMEGGSTYLDSFVLINPPEGYNPRYIFASSYYL
ncbi:hypothetical protein BGZ95_011987 [Linnemannia exigua]|uniref:Uncharacterized protein n=1 Tax=Linnemannia exigua TaxID=604196 RepID=A0AAD4DJW3_9FUNG|nr:hypothetical protein BGZ95_011987 [Linnemannia exigua]